MSHGKISLVLPQNTSRVAELLSVCPMHAIPKSPELWAAFPPWGLPIPAQQSWFLVFISLPWLPRGGREFAVCLGRTFWDEFWEFRGCWLSLSLGFSTASVSLEIFCLGFLAWLCGAASPWFSDWGIYWLLLVDLLRHHLLSLAFLNKGMNQNKSQLIEI